METNYFQHSDLKLNSRFPHQILFFKIRLFVSKLMKHETTNRMKTKKSNTRAEPSTTKAKGKINWMLQLLSNIFFVRYFPQYFQALFEYDNTQLLDFIKFSDLTHISNSEFKISLMPL